MSKPIYDKLAYQHRYIKVYEAGASFWEDPTPTEELVEFVSQMKFAKGSKAIEFGCGEGRDSIFLAKHGFEVTALDVGSSAIKRAKQRATLEGAAIEFVIADATNLNSFPSSTYDLAVNVGCLQMIVNEKDRQRHLVETLHVLKPKGIYFSCNLGGYKPVQLEDIYRERQKPGDLTPRKIKADGKNKEILLPIIAAWPKSGGQYKEEFETAGFKILTLFHRMTRPLGSCWVLVALKPASY